ncbi:MAG: ATP-binding protein [bacterium]
MSDHKAMKILLVDDEPLFCETFQDILTKEGYEVTVAHLGEDALEELNRQTINVAIIDIHLPDRSGLDILKSIKTIHPDICSIMLTGYATVESSIKALNEGAFAYITKPYNIDEVKAIIRNAAEQQRLCQENRRLLQTLKQNNVQLTEAKHQLELFNHELESMVEKRTMELAQEKAKHEKIIKTIADGLCTIDQDLNIISFNRTAEEITGYTAEEALRMKCHQVFKTEACRSHCFLQQVIQDKHPIVNTEMLIYNRRNHPVPILFSMDIFHDDSGRVIGGVKTFHDITGLRSMQDELTRTNQILTSNQKELKDAYQKLHKSKKKLNQWASNLDLEVRQRTKELQEANERLKELDRHKSEFLAMVSHELKTPLTAIIGYSTYLLNMSPEEQILEINDGLSRISRNGYLLLDLINKLLEFSRIEAGKISLELEQFDLREIIEESLLITAPIARERNIQLIFVPPDFHEMIEADRQKIKQIFLNLLSNAVKFTEKPDSKITILIEANDRSVQVTISDEGVGIRLEDQEIIFGRFFQVDPCLSRKFGGVGLGLSIVKKFIDIHHGKIWVESELQKGSHFIFQLPKQQKDSATVDYL